VPGYLDLDLDNGTSSESTSDDTRSTRRPYRHPRLTTIATADALLEALGPAQANYGEGGFGP
jgi:hypothetical protein